MYKCICVCVFSSCSDVDGDRQGFSGSTVCVAGEIECSSYLWGGSSVGFEYCPIHQCLERDKIREIERGGERRGKGRERGTEKETERA